MCGRFSMTGPTDAVLDEFGPVQLTFDYRPRYNIAPTQDVAALVRDGDGARIGPLRWGLVPRWADAPFGGTGHINARAETVAEKPSFRRAFNRRRCLVLADGYYEWKRTDAGKVPMRIRRADGRPFAFAGLWERWTPPDAGEPLHSCAIITTSATRALRRMVHPRMPVILRRPTRDRWLEPDADRDALLALLRPCEDTGDGGSRLEAYRVSTAVNAPRNDGPECVEPV